MLRFTRTSVRGFDIDALVVSWEVDPVDKVAFNINDVEFRVYRSNSPEGPFDLLTGTPLVDEFSFRDTSVNRRSFWRKFYYKVEATSILTGKTVSSVTNKAEVNPTLAARMLIGLEIVRRERILLGGAGNTPGFNGVKCMVLIRRTFGQHCAECYDPVLERKLADKCTRCYGVSYVGGFFTPIPVYFNFNPTPQSVQIANFGEVQPSETDCWCSNYPLMSPGDVVVEPTNRRWRVSRVHSTQMLRVPIRQLLRMSEINRSDVEYLIPLDESEFDREPFHKLMSNNNEFEEIKR